MRVLKKRIDKVTSCTTKNTRVFHPDGKNFLETRFEKS
ncbi:hypothetical protein FM107_01315 [Sphingobacterium sp. JB170]|nr:hypothetical protein FM107_01315 [Sphingobacterium sp. JB170]